MVQDPAAPLPSASAGGPCRWLNRTVVGAGLTSALGDLCYETTTVLLPGFFAVLGLPAAALGTIEGLADAVASFTKMAAGFLADKLGHRKAQVLAGYGLTPCGQALMALAAGWPLILLGRLVSWFGKGLRGPLRDAIVAQAIRPESRGRAFGFHRAMDTLGAVAGPLLGVSLLGWLQTRSGDDAVAPFRLIFWLTLIPGTLAVLAFAILVADPGHTPNPGLRLAAVLRGWPLRFQRYLAGVGLFGCGDFSHTLLILAAIQWFTPTLGPVPAAQVAGALYVLRNGVQAGASYPIGVLADRFGALPVLTIGYLLGALTAAGILLGFALGIASPLFAAGVFAVAGLYMAVQEAMEAPVTVDCAGSDRLATSLGALGTVNGGTKFVSSALVGLLWTAISPLVAFGCAACLMAAGTLALARLGREATASSTPPGGIG